VDDQHTYPVPQSHKDWFAIDVRERPTLYTDPEPPRPPSRWQRIKTFALRMVRKRVLT
jgi:hypothetical protein